MFGLTGIRLALSLGAAALALGGASYGGWKFRDADYQAHLKDDLEAEKDYLLALSTKQQALEEMAQKWADAVAKDKEEIRVVTNTIIKEVPYYVTNTKIEKIVVANGGLPDGFVRLHNYSATGQKPPATVSPEFAPDAPSGVSLSTLSSTVSRNYQVCALDRSELEGWKGWYRDLEKEWNNEPAGN